MILWIIYNSLKYVIKEWTWEIATMRVGCILRNYNKPTHWKVKWISVRLIDYEKALDSTEHPDLFQALREIGINMINEGYICIMEDMFTDVASYNWTVMFLKS